MNQYEDVPLINSGPEAFWISVALMLLVSGVATGYFISFYGSLYFLAINFVLFSIFYGISYQLQLLSVDVWKYTVSIQPMLLPGTKATSNVVEDLVPASIFMTLFIIIDLLALVVYWVLVRPSVLRRQITLTNRIFGAILGFVQIMILLSLLFELVGSDVFYTSSNFHQDFTAVVTDPGSLHTKHNDISNNFLYHFFTFIDKI